MASSVCRIFFKIGFQDNKLSMVGSEKLPLVLVGISALAHYATTHITILALLNNPKLDEICISTH